MLRHFHDNCFEITLSGPSLACAGKGIIAMIFDRRRRSLQNQLPKNLENGLSYSHQTYREGRPVGPLHSRRIWRHQLFPVSFQAAILKNANTRISSKRLEESSQYFVWLLILWYSLGTFPPFCSASETDWLRSTHSSVHAVSNISKTVWARVTKLTGMVDL